MQETMQRDEQQDACLLEGQVRLELKKLELSKLEAKLTSLRDDWDCRQEQLQSTKSIVLDEKTALEDSLAATLQAEREDAEREMAGAQVSFNAEVTALTDEKNDLNQKFKIQKQRHEEEEFSLRGTSLQLSSEIYKMCADHAKTLTCHKADIEALKAKLELDSDRRLELEEHFARVDRNNAAMELEEEKLRRVAAKEEEATQMLNQGDRGIQKLFRGMIARRAFHKLKKQKSKKKGKKGKKKGKK